MDYRSMAYGSLKTALVVGSMLIFLNRYEEIMTGNFSGRDVFKWSLNYLMPFASLSILDIWN